MKKKIGLGLLLVVAAVLAVLLLVPSQLRQKPKPPPPSPPPIISRVLKPAERAAVLRATQVKPREDRWHPPHMVKVWTAVHRNRVFRVIQLPHCEHLETVIAYNRFGESVKQAKMRNHGVAACTGSFHNPRSMVLADFLQQKGSIVSCASTGRSFVSIDATGRLDISCDYASIKGKPGVSALALGQKLVPLQRDGFSLAFMNKYTDRMAIGINKSFIFIVQGRSDIWRLAEFMRTKLPVTSAINCDGGHVVRGKGPVHLVFRWKTVPKPASTPAQSGASTNR